MVTPESSSGARARPAEQAAGRFSRATASASRRGNWRGIDQASVMVVELLSGLLVWGGVGWLIGTRIGGHPWPFVIGSLLGFAGGFYLLWLRAEGRIGRPPQTALSSTGDDDADAEEEDPEEFVDGAELPRSDAEAGVDADGEPGQP